MKLVKVGDDRMLEFDRLSSVAFTFAMKDPEPEKPKPEGEVKQPESGRSEYWAMLDEDRDKLMGGMVLMDYQTRIGDSWLPLSGVGGVATLPEYRRAGVIRGVFNEVLPMMYERGMALSGLYPFSHAFYRKFGYETFGGQNMADVGLEQLRGFEQPDEVRMIEDSRDMLSARAIYERFAQTRDLSMRRHFDSQWKKIMGGDAYRERVYKYLLMRRSGNELEPCAYIAFSPEDVSGGGRIAAAREAAYLDGDAFRRMLGFMSTFFPHYSRVRLALPGDVDLAAICKDAYDVHCHVERGYMLRAVNAKLLLESQPVSPALRMAAKAAPLEFTLALTDGIIAKNTGLYRVRISEGGVSCTLEPMAQADIELGITGFTQLVTGTLSLAQAVFSGTVREFSPCPAAHMLFVKRPQYIADHY